MERDGRAARYGRVLVLAGAIAAAIAGKLTGAASVLAADGGIFGLL